MTVKSKPEQRMRLLEAMQSAGMELAEYASYAEIVGGVSANRVAVRKWSDKVYAIQKQIEAIEESMESEGWERDSETS